MQTELRYSILSDGPPLGPFAADEIRAKLAAQEFTSGMKFCPVGTRDWLPLERFPTEEASSDAAAPVSTVSAAEPKQGSTFASIMASLPIWMRNEAVLGGIVLAAVLAAIGLAIWWLTPLTPRQVVERFIAADTLSESMKYATVNLHPAIRAMENVDEDSDPADRFELTQDRAAPAAIGGHLVGCSFRFRDAETKQLIHGGGYFHLIQADGWKVEDLYFTAVNGEALEAPYSLAQNYRTLFPPPPKPAPSGTAAGSQRQNQFFIHAIARWMINGLKGGGGKVLAGLALAVLVGIGSLFTKRKAGGGGA